MSDRKKMAYVAIEDELYRVPEETAAELQREQHEPDFGMERDEVLNAFRRRYKDKLVDKIYYKYNY